MSRRGDARRPRAKRPAPLAGAVEELLGNLGIPAVRSLVVLSRKWAEICGELLAGRTSPAELRNGTLAVLVANHSWAQELQFSRPILLERIRAILGQDSVTDIRFVVGQMPEDDREPPPFVLPPPSTVPLPEPEGLLEIDDPELRAAILSIQRKAFDRGRA